MAQRLLLLFLLVALSGCGGELAAPHLTGTPSTTVTIGAGDPNGGALTDLVTVWSLGVRTGIPVGVVRDQQKVTLIQYDSEGALIQLTDGTQGWVDRRVIVELRS
jgi:hypothetical protein